MRYIERSLCTSILLLLVTMSAACSQKVDNEIVPQGAVGEQFETVRGSVPAGSFQLRYQVEGTGTPTIVIGSSVYLPRAFSNNLRKHLRMVYLDHRGYAPSPGPMNASAFAENKLIDDVERARQQLGLGRIVVMGHSIHSIIALEYAKKYSDNVSHVVMIGAPRLMAEDQSVVGLHFIENIRRFV